MASSSDEQARLLEEMAEKLTRVPGPRHGYGCGSDGEPHTYDCAICGKPNRRSEDERAACLAGAAALRRVEHLQSLADGMPTHEGQVTSFAALCDSIDSKSIEDSVYDHCITLHCPDARMLVDHVDARLIAAAPDLLDALRQIVGTYEAYDAMTGEGHEDCIYIAKAAIAKAEGDQT